MAHADTDAAGAALVGAIELACDVSDVQGHGQHNSGKEHHVVT